MPSSTTTGGAAVTEALPERVRSTCAAVAEVAESVRIDDDGVRRLADVLATELAAESAAELGSAPDPAAELRAPGLRARSQAEPEVPAEWLVGDVEHRCGLVLALDAVNFGSGWHPLLRKRPGLSGARTVAAAFTEWWVDVGWPGPDQVLDLLADGEGPAGLPRGGGTIAAALGQSASGEPGRLMGLFADSLVELATYVVDDHGGRWSSVVTACGGSAARLAALLAVLPHWDDRARHPGTGDVWLFKRAQIAAADLALARVATFADVDRLTCMADNLIPHVLRLDGVLDVEASVMARIDRGELLEAGEPAEIELRAVAVQAVERLSHELATRGAPRSPAALDRRLWWRGRSPRYKAEPRHRCRTTAY
jgi:hypothetical protein